MAIDLTKLENLSDRADHYLARCPACGECGGDSAGNHLYIFKANLAYRCVAHKDDSEHSRKVYALVGEGDGHKLSAKEFLDNLERKGSRQQEGRLIEKYQKEWPRIRSEWAWPVNEIKLDSPSVMSLPPPETHWRRHLSLFDPDDLLWIGERYDSGDCVQPYSFTTQTNLVRWPDLPVQVPLTTTAIFKTGATSRCDDQVLSKKYLVVESDTLSKDDTGAVFNFLRENLQLHLRMVVDTGGSSIHGHFSYPSPDMLADLKVRLKAWGCDPAMFGLSQPCRLAGVYREETGQWQKIIYFDKRPQRRANPRI